MENIGWKELQAGPLRMRFENGDLRYICWGRHEILRRIYAALRDRNWGTIPAQISNLKLEMQERSFQIAYEASHRERDIDFVWHAELTGDEAGTIRFTFDGEARSTFLRNRIGICILHPAELAGASCRVRYTNGSEYAAKFPELVAAEQPVTFIHDLGSISHEITPGLWADISFSGDLFEMEDQRNWIDASYKTFCTPLRIPFPMEVSAGTRITQSVELRLRKTAPVEIAVPAPAASVRLQRTELRFPLPPFGFGLSEHPLSSREVECLAKLRPAHLRVDLPLTDTGMAGTFARAAGESARLQAPLEMAIFLGDNAAAELQSLASLVEKRQPRIARWLVFDGNAKSSSARSLQLAREILQRFGAPIGGGTNADFYQLNQFRPPADRLDFVAFSMNPQMHAFDDTSLVETLTVIPHPVRSARQYFNGLPVVVSPVTFKPRFNAVATETESAPLPDQLPPNVDLRQMTLLGAAWTLGAARRLAESGAASVTLFETAGWRGVMERDAGSPLPHLFPSAPGAVFPLYHVLADVAEFTGGAMIEVQSDAPLRVEAMLLEDGKRQTLLLANLTPLPQLVTMPGLSLAACIRRLDQQAVSTAKAAVESFRQAFAPNSLAADSIGLSPYETLRLDWYDSTLSNIGPLCGPILDIEVGLLRAC
jgi:hypothetical protein